MMKLLYMTFISLDDCPASGSSVRPRKMKEAFESLGIELRVYDGKNNVIAERKKTVAEIRRLLKTWRPDGCYIEPPSGPLFYFGDIKLIRKLHRMGIPLSLFYRDAYWKYPEYCTEKKISIVEKIKRIIVKLMQIYQWNMFRTNIDMIYFPSMTMANEFECSHKSELPPGAFIADVEEMEELSKPLQAIFVGGAAKNHGTLLTIEAFHKLNKAKTLAKLFYICPRNQWEGLGIDQKKYEKWLEVVHISGDAKLKPYYERADFAVLTAPRTVYRDFAIPIKIFEYLSYLKPILVTNCTETAKLIEDNHIGWVTTDHVDSIVEKLQELSDHPDEIKKVKMCMADVREKNLWVRRAEKVIFDLVNQNQ